MLERYKGQKNLNIPNAITTLRTIGAVVGSAAYLKTNKLRYFVAAGIFHMADGLDGWTARRYEQETNLGHDIDKLGDKVAQFAGMVASMIRRDVDWPVALAAGAVSLSNIMATGYSKYRGNLLEEANEAGRENQKWMLGGYAVNVIGKHQLKNANNPYTAATYQVMRFAGATVSIGSAIGLGVPSSLDYWHSALNAAPPAETPELSPDQLNPQPLANPL